MEKYRSVRKIVTMDELSTNCGLFTSDTDQNNGYGCQKKKTQAYALDLIAH